MLCSILKPLLIKAAIIRDFHSAKSTQVLKFFTCASCAERVRHEKLCDRLVSDVSLDILKNSAVMDPDTPATVPPVLYMDGPLAGALVDPAGIHQNEDGSLSLSLCPSCKSAS